MLRGVFLYFVYLVVSVASAQHVDVLNLKNGLTNNYVQCMLQDDQGYIWIGTRDGLNVYDEHQVRTYRHELSSSFVYSLMQHSNGDIWIGSSQGGIDVYNPSKKAFSSLNQKSGFEFLRRTDVYDLYEDNQLDVWVCTLQGLGKIPNGADTLFWFQEEYQGENRAFTSVFQDKYQTIWVGTNHGLWTINQSEENVSLNPADIPALRNVFVRDIEEDESGNLWIATDEHGIIRFDPQTKITTEYSVDQRQNAIPQVWNLHKDSKGNMWAAVINDGLYKCEKGASSFQRYQDKISTYFKFQSTTGVIEDFNGNLWVASHGDGVCFFDPNKYVFEKHLSSQELGSQHGAVIVSSFLEDHAGNIWIGTDGAGVKQMKSSNRITDAYSTMSGLSSNIILNMIEDDMQNIWLATWHGGVNQLDPKSGKVTIFDEKRSAAYGLKSPDVKSLMIDSLSRMWMATHGKGVAIYDLANQKFIPPASVSSGYHPDYGQWGSDFLNTKNGDIWIASHAGLFRYKGDSVQSYYAGKYPGMLASSLIYCLFEDSHGDVWVGTSNSLEKFIPEQNAFKNYSTGYGVPVNVKCILEDDHEQLWISTTHEITMLDLETKKVTHFGDSYNIQEGEFHQCACMKTQSGKMFFGGTEGFNSFWPDSLTDRTLSSRLLITDLYIFNEKQIPDSAGSVIQQAMPYITDLTLSYDQNVVSFEFLSLSYPASNKTKYSYLMEGFNDEWSPASANRLATYTNLDPGAYVFRVKSMSDTGELLNETSLNLFIVPPFWMTIWFRLLVGISIIFMTVGVLISRLYSSKQKRLELQKLVKEKTREVQDKNILLEEQATDLYQNNAELKDLVSIKDRLFSIIGHDLRNPFNSLLGFTKLLNTQYSRYSEDERKKLINSLHNSSSAIYSLLDNLLIWSKSQQDQLLCEPNRLLFIAQVQNQFGLIKDSADKKMIRLVMSPQPDLSFMADKNMLSTILRNLLSNAIKYSPINGEIEVGYALTNSGLEIYVKDEGIGVDNPEALFQVSKPIEKQRDHNHGLGLILCKDFVEKHGGIIRAEKNLEKGACFSFTLPNSKAVIESENAQQSQSYVETEENTNPQLEDKELEILPLVLIVEDDDDIRWYIRQTLFPEFRVIESVNGINGEKMVLDQMPDLIISDMNMPGINGLELCAKIKSNAQTCHIPLVLLTAERSNDKRIDGYEKGADDYITKPVDANVLRARIMNILDSRRALKSLYQRDITSDPASITTNSLDQEFIQKLNAIIESRIDDQNLNPDTLASDMGVSRTGLYMKIKAITDESVSIYIRNVRLKEARLLLKSGKMNISEVAYAVGFNQLPYFTSCFKAAFGVTPSEYLRK